jgi:hypothetical protein
LSRLFELRYRVFCHDFLSGVKWGVRVNLFS